MRLSLPVAVAILLGVGGSIGWALAAPPRATRWSQAIDAAAAEAGVDRTLLDALVVVESGGDPEARSRTGAIGLLQVMPATGEETARRLGIPWRGETTLEDPVANLRIGAAYLRRLLDRFDGQSAFAVAAYNAGPERVKAWRWRAADTDALTAILREGFPETRRHTWRVLSLMER